MVETIQSGITVRHTSEKSKAFLNQISGADEKRIRGSATADLVRLIENLIEQRGEFSMGVADISGLSASDRDRLIAALYRDIYGDRIDATLRCRACEAMFDIDFQLESLQQSLGQEKTEASPDGVHQTPQEYLFRLPTSEDEIEISGIPPSAAYAKLLEKILIDPTYQSLLAEPESYRNEVIGAVEESLTRIAPIIDLEVAARCPECATDHTVHFDLQCFLMERLLQDRRTLMHEIHMIANAYGWGLNSILSLDRKERKELTNLIDDHGR